MKITTKVTLKGFSAKEFLADIEKDARKRLDSKGLTRVKVRTVTEGGRSSLKLDADTNEELAKAVKVLGIRM